MISAGFGLSAYAPAASSGRLERPGRKMPSTANASLRRCSRGKGSCCCAAPVGNGRNGSRSTPAVQRIAIRRHEIRVLLASHALLPRRIKLISGLPALLGLCFGCQPAQIKAELRHPRIPPEVHLRFVFIAWLMVPLRGVLFHLLRAPACVVSGKERPLSNRKCWNPMARQRKMIGAIVVTRGR